ncbi:MAG: hypothetical protein GX287_00030 [Fusobacteria bacterium]|nr:hypothetical protein [Fusobacteriota bacterium]
MDLENYKNNKKNMSKNDKKLLNSYEREIEENEKLDEAIIANLNLEKIRFKEEIVQFETIDTIISFLSISSQSIEAFEKTLYLFENRIKRIMLFYTYESSYKLKRLEDEYKSIKFITKNISSVVDDYSLLHYFIMSTIRDNRINYDNIIIDNTLGFKMVGLAMYQISVEQNIKTINWKQQFKDGTNKIIVGSDTYNLIKIPRLENYSLYKNINQTVEKCNFEALYILYSHINNYNKSIIFKFLNEIFDDTLRIDFNSFKERASNLLNEIYKLNLNSDEKKTFNKIIIIIKNIVEDIKNNKDDKHTIYYYERKNNWDEQNLKLEINIENENKYYIWRYLTLVLLEIKYKNYSYLGRQAHKLLEHDAKINDNIEFIRDFFKEKSINDVNNIDYASIWVYYKNIIHLFSITTDLNVTLDEISDHKKEEYEDFFKNIEKTLQFELQQIHDFYTDIFNFKENIGKKIIVQNEKIYIDKLNVDININLITAKKNSEQIKYIIDSIMREDFFNYVSKNSIKEEIRAQKIKELDDENDEIREATIRKAISRLWKEYKYFNEKVEEIYKIKDFFIITDDEKIKINDSLL